MSFRPTPTDWLPDARDGLSRVERIVLHTLSELQQERAAARTRPNVDDHVAMTMLYGRVLERVDITVAELQAIVGRLAGRGVPGGER
jgi:hypothetical protein